MDFACKRIEMEELFRCSFGITKTEHRILALLLEQERPCTIARISKSVSLERTTIQKALSALTEKRLVKRTQHNLDKGGYVFFYETVNKKKIKSRLKKVVFDWCERLRREVDEW